MVIAIDGKWIWDSWYVHDGEKWHGYFLQADRALGDPELRHFNVSQGHATSADLVNWTHLGTTLRPSDVSAWDDFTTWTGSVVLDDAGLWHLFYTGSNRAEKGLYQRIGHATSIDGHSWQRVNGGLCLDLSGPIAELYEKDHMVGHWHDRAMRDPWVMRNPDGPGWLMYFTARAPGIAEPNAGGAIGLATSGNLMNWILQPPVFVGSFGQLEVPQVFRLEDRWCCLFCTSGKHWSDAYRASNVQSPVSGSHYLVADHPKGPWHVAPGDFFDGAEPCKRYASRILQTPEGLCILGFSHGAPDQFGGYVMDPERVTVGPDGLLHIHPLDLAAE